MKDLFEPKSDVIRLCKLVHSITVNSDNLRMLPVDQYGEGDNFDHISFEANKAYLLTQEKELVRLIKKIAKS